MSTLDELTTPLTFDEIRGSIYAVLSATGVTTTTWKPGAVVRTIISAVAIVMVGLSALIALIAKSAFLSLATGEWLRLVAFYVYNVVRIEATFATGFVTLVNVAGGVYDAAPGDWTFRNTTTGATYVNTAAIHVGSLTTVTGIPIAAVAVGSASTSFGGEITLVTSLTGVTCTNPAPVIGYDVESDPALRLRCTEKLGSLSPNGPADSYGYVARTATRADGSPIGVTRVRAAPDGNGGVNVYLSTPSGAVPGTVGDTTTDLGIIDAALQRQCTPLCVVCRTYSATPRNVPVFYSVWLYNTSGLTDAGVTAAINAGLADYFAGAPIGGNTIGGGVGTIYKSELIAIIGRARTSAGIKLPIVRVEVPNVDILLAPNEVAVLAAVVPTINQFSPGGI